MISIAELFALIKIVMLGMSVILALIYALPIVLMRRFHHRLNVLTLNICFAMICSSTFWLSYFIMWEYFIKDLFTERTCLFLFYLQMLSSCQTPFSFVMLTIHRFCSIVYATNRFFKTKKFLVMCLLSQWIIAGLLSLPFATNILPYCAIPPWLSFYRVVILVVLPAFVLLVFNLGILKHVHSSSRRIQANNNTTQANVHSGRQPPSNRRDRSLLKHVIFMSCIFLIGWGPVFSLVAIDYKGNVAPLVYTILQLWAVFASFTCMMNLFLYNHELRQFLKTKIACCS